MQSLSVHFARCFKNEEYFCCLRTASGAFRTRNSFVVCVLRAVLLGGIQFCYCALCKLCFFSQTRNTLVDYALRAVLLEK